MPGEDWGMDAHAEDLVVLLDDRLEACGTAPRRTVHGPSTPLHLAFSCYVLDEGGRVLMTRRSLAKLTFPGVWTNACCGHPRPGEPFEDAITRRLADELGVGARGIRPVLSDFRYSAVDAAGVRENEFCPVFVAVVDGDLDPDPAEVMDHQWADPGALGTVAADAPWLLSPWSVAQIRLMDMPALAGIAQRDIRG